VEEIVFPDGFERIPIENPPDVFAIMRERREAEIIRQQREIQLRNQRMAQLAPRNLQPQQVVPNQQFFPNPQQQHVKIS
jgi:hypothetical protein